MNWKTIWPTALVAVVVIVLLNVTGLGMRINDWVMKLKPGAKAPPVGASRL